MDKDLKSTVEEMDRLIPKHYDQVVFSRRADGEIDGEADWDNWGRPRIRITAKTLPEAMVELVLALKSR